MKQGTRTVLALALSASLAQGSLGNLSYAYAADGDPIGAEQPAGGNEGQDTPQNGLLNGEGDPDAINGKQLLNATPGSENNNEPSSEPLALGSPLLGAPSDDSATYTINYDANGGTGSIDFESVSVKPGEHATVTLPTSNEFTRSGYQLEAWEIEGSNYEPGSPLTFEGDITATAVWKWAQGSVQLNFGIVQRDSHRNSMQEPRGSSLGWVSIPYYSSGSAELLDENGVVVESYVGQSQHKFTNLPAGTYTLHVTLDPNVFIAFESVVNGSSGRLDNFMTSFDHQVVVTEGNTSTVNAYIVVEYRAFGLATVSEIGTFENGTKEHVYYKGGNWSFKNTDTSSNHPTFNTHNGIYYGDSPDLYSGMNKLEVPTLSPEELAAGYRFIGWRLQGDTSGKIYSETEALAHVIRTHTVFEAVWSYPTHNVTFSTNTDFGTINGKASYGYTEDFDNRMVGDNIPEVEPKEGYEFLGWYSDLTTNVIPEESLKLIQVNKDLHFYAKYKKIETEEAVENYTVTYLPGDHGTLSGTDELMLPAGSFIPTIPSVTPEEGYDFTGKWEVVAVGADSPIAVGDVMNEVQISRLQLRCDLNLKALYEKTKPAPRDGIDGKDGADGKDGRDGIDGKDGADGKDGLDGKDGKDGVDGKDGRDGIDGKDGKDGADGKDAADAKEDEPKEDESEDGDDQGLIVEDVETPKDEQPKDDAKDSEPQSPADEPSDEGSSAPKPAAGVVSGTLVTGSTGTTGTSGVVRSGVVSGSVTPSTMTGSNGTVVSSASSTIPKMGDQNQSLAWTLAMGVAALASAGFARRKAKEQ